MDVNYDDYSVPIFQAGQNQQTVQMEDYEGNPGDCPKLDVTPDGTVSVPASIGTVRPSGPKDIEADGHLVLYEPDARREYDFWQATTARDGGGNSLGGGRPGSRIFAAGTVDYFDLGGSGANPDSYWSARATGTPLLAGLIVPEDIERGRIEHALAFAIPGPRNTNRDDPYEPLSKDYFYPASTTEGDYFNTNPQALAAGQRLRLKKTIVDESGDTIDEEDLAPITRMFLEALRTYGAYLVDNAGGFTFYAEDIHTAVLHLTNEEVKELTGRAPGSSLPAGKSGWRLAMEKLNEDLEQIPIAYGPWYEGQDPSTATITRSNFEVVARARRP
jgi:hypothetical protein